MTDRRGNLAKESSDASPGWPADRHLVEECKGCDQNLRHYSNMRFAELTLFFAVNAALFSVVFREPELGQLEQVVATVVGIFVSIMFGIMNRRRVALWAALHRRAVALEHELGLAQYSSRPPEGILSNRNAARALYVLMFLIWLVLFIVMLRDV